MYIYICIYIYVYIHIYIYICIYTSSKRALRAALGHCNILIIWQKAPAAAITNRRNRLIGTMHQSNCGLIHESINH